ncbi:neuroguidin-A-like [Mya arenaria]|uniref:neuroguidin-A-like n=1 Tax=Mya arenaria TaxID=6604 RepID=UPI0022E58661|nr:neuroguidin-A-like [Mya arenaria]XP_052818607.1 neuroguidin-A-like [Mya arenaria]
MEGDVEKATTLLKDIHQKCRDFSNHINDLCTKAKNGEFNTSKGISFLEVKYQLLLSYLVNLTYLLLQKARGQSINGDRAVLRLVEIRTVLEKMRPIDQKLKYQVDKVVRLAATGGAGSNDPMRFKANPDSLQSKLEDESGSGSGSEEEEDKSKVYKPPKLAAVHYDGDETMLEKKQRQVDHLRKRALNSDILQDLREQYDEGPQEIRETHDMHRLKENKRAKEKTRYEEDNFLRLPTMKKDQQTRQHVATISSLNTLTHFGSISALDMEDGDHSGVPNKRRKAEKSKGKSKKKGKKGFKRKKRH